MKKLVFCLLCSLLLSAQEKLTVGMHGLALNYTEYHPADDSVIDTESSKVGDVIGIYAQYDHQLYNDENSEVLATIFASYIKGDTQYVGSYLSDPDSSFGDVKNITRNRFIDTNANIKFIQDNRWILLAGFGYKNWERALTASQIETYYWSYFQVGGGYRYQLDASFRLGVEAKVQVAFAPKIDIPFIANGVVLDLGTTRSYIVAMPLDYAFTDAIMANARLEYEYTTIEKSNAYFGFLEPRSIQNNMHLYLGLSYLF